MHEAHAIEQVVFVLQFDQDLDEAPFAKILEAAKLFKHDLPGIVKTQSLTFVIGPAQQNQQEAINGTSFRRVEPDGTVGHELQVERASLIFRTSLYSRWDTVWLQANKYFSALVPIYAKQAKLSGISLNYVDKFVWSGELAECSANLLLKDNSLYLCPHVYKAKDFWHSHTGVFMRVNDNTKRLLNVNVDYLDEMHRGEPRRIVSVTTVLTDQLNQPGYELRAIEEDSIMSFISAHMQELHVFGKEVLGGIINDTMSRRIALVE